MRLADGQARCVIPPNRAIGHMEVVGTGCAKHMTLQQMKFGTTHAQRQCEEFPDETLQ